MGVPIFQNKQKSKLELKPEYRNICVKANNIELIEKATGEKIDLVANEQSLPMSQKRKEKYD